MEDVYLYNVTVGIARHKYDGLDYNMQMICHIEKEDNTDKSNLIGIEVLKFISRNATKWLRM